MNRSLRSVGLASLAVVLFSVLAGCTVPSGIQAKDPSNSAPPYEHESRLSR